MNFLSIYYTVVPRPNLLLSLVFSMVSLYIWDALVSQKIINLQTDDDEKRQRSLYKDAQQAGAGR